MKRRRRSKIINAIILLMFILVNISCIQKKNIEFKISIDNRDVIENLVKSDTIIIEKKIDTIKLKIIKTKLKTNFGREMGASTSSLILYDELVKNYNQLDTNTIFNIIYLSDNIEYHYSILDLSDVLLGEKNIENYFNSIENKKPKNKNNHNINLCQFGGFKIDKFNREISYRVFLNEEYNTHVNIVLEKSSKKILKISK